MKIDPSALDAEANYKLLTGIVVPRPIAWISSLGSNEQINLAPFSAFTFVSNQPPMLAVTIGRRLGALKDTARNIANRREFVVNIANLDLLEALHSSGTEYPEEVSEVELLKLSTQASERVRCPRLAAAPVSMECVLHNIIEFGVAKSQLVIGEILLFHIRDDLTENGKVDTQKLNPICRLGGPLYATLGKVFGMKEIAG